jgi:hypothetical protein|tara:strand:- start:1389 stop:1613 length:225 start_codon:yes stop_codon:yes gene_type:complete
MNQPSIGTINAISIDIHAFIQGNIILLASETLYIALKLHSIDRSNGPFTCLSVIFGLFAISSRSPQCQSLAALL